MIVGFDWGNRFSKIMCELGIAKFSSSIGEYWDRNLENAHGEDDMVFEYQGRKGFAGSLAENESDFGSSIMGDSKAHEDALIRLLLGLHRCGDDLHYKVVVGQPISKHTPEEKAVIKQMIKGKHTITVNGVTRTFWIDECEVAAEGGSAFWSAPVEGKIRIIDVGSGTVNCASLNNKRYVNKDSFTLPFGMETIHTYNMHELSRGIYSSTSKRWSNNDQVYLVGGAANDLLEPMRRYYRNVKTMKPVVNGATVDPIFANAIGFYQIGRAIYGKEDN